MWNLYSRSSPGSYDGIVVEGRHSPDQFRTKGLTIDPVTSNLYVCDDLLVSIKVFSSNFDLLFTFTIPSLQKAGGICISHDKVFITDRINPIISVFTLQGVIISKYSFSTKKKWYQSSPSGIAVDKDGDIYTCDCWHWANKITVLTHDDECRHHYFAPSSLKSPRDVKLCQDKVIVLDSLEDIINICRRTVELKVYSKMKVLLNVIRVEDVYGDLFFDVTQNSNYVISSTGKIVFVSKNGKVLRRSWIPNFFISNTAYPVVLDMHTFVLTTIRSMKL